MFLKSSGIRLFYVVAMTALCLTVAPFAMAADSDPWTQKGVALSGSLNGDVALSGDGTVVAVGLAGHSNYDNTIGEVRVYAWTSGGWVQRGATIRGAGTRDHAGKAIALSDDGSILVVGVPGDCGGMYGTGRLSSVRVYFWNESVSSWGLRGDPLSGATLNDCFGQTVALSDDGTVLAVGSERFNGSAGAYSGRVTLYQWTGGGWASVRSVEGQGDDSGFGAALSINGAGTRIAVGTHNDEGRVRVFDVNAESSSQVGTTLTGAQTASFGRSLSLDDSGDVLAVGDSGPDSQRGRVTVYALSAGVWTQRGAALDGEATGDRSGESVALSGGGFSVAIGGPGNRTHAGHTRVYRWSGSVWVQRGGDIDGLFAQDGAGTRVAIDDAGLGVATNLNDANSSVGEVRVYTRSGPPGRPLNVSGTTGNGSVTVVWSPPASDGGMTITGYTATAGTGESCSVTSIAPASPATTCRINGLTNGASYTFTVTATNAEGTSSASVASSLVTPVAPTTPVSTPVSTPASTPASTPVSTTSKAAAFEAGSNTSVTQLLRTASVTAPTGAKARATTSTPKVCKVTGQKVVFLAAGTCKGMLLVTPKKGKATKKPFAIVVTKTKRA